MPTYPQILSVFLENRIAHTWQNRPTAQPRSKIVCEFLTRFPTSSNFYLQCCSELHWLEFWKSFPGKAFLRHSRKIPFKRVSAEALASLQHETRTFASIYSAIKCILITSRFRHQQHSTWSCASQAWGWLKCLWQHHVVELQNVRET